MIIIEFAKTKNKNTGRKLEPWLSKSVQEIDWKRTRMLIANSAQCIWPFKENQGNFNLQKLDCHCLSYFDQLKLKPVARSQTGPNCEWGEGGGDQRRVGSRSPARTIRTSKERVAQTRLRKQCKSLFFRLSQNKVTNTDILTKIECCGAKFSHRHDSEKLDPA